MKNGFGNGVLNFRPLRTGQSESLSLTLRNTSKLPAKVHLDLEDPQNFDISPMDGYEYKISTPKSDPDLGHSAATHLEVGQESQFLITFSSDKAGIYKSCVRNYVAKF